MSRYLFAGDSITAGFDLKKYLPEYQTDNFGVSGISSAELKEMVHPDWFVHPPDGIFICIGTNDLARGINDTGILKNVAEMVKQVQQYARNKNHCIFLTSIFPTRNNESRPNARIDLLNAKLHELAMKLNIRYLHLHPFFKDEEGKLHVNYTCDGLHLNEAAYEKWAALLKKL